MKRGFTLIELLVVLAIISLISAFVGPRVISSFANLHVKTATREIAGTLRYNRSQAVTEKLLRVAIFDLDGRRIRMFSLMGMTSYAPEEKIMETPADMTYELPEGVRFKEAISGEDTYETGEIPIVFFPNGSSSGGGPHQCIGMGFALVEAQLVLAAIMQRYRMELVPGYRAELKPSITLHPKGGMPMVLRPVMD